MRFGFITGLGIIFTLIASLMLGAAAFTSGGEIFSPGGLNSQSTGDPLGGVSSHAELGCSDCHAPFWSPETMGDRCLDCHADIAEELNMPESVHGELADPSNCRTCHSEHHGATAELTSYDEELYPHAEFGFYLLSHRTLTDGQPFQCDDCHVEGIGEFGLGVCGQCHLDIDRTFFTNHFLDFGTSCLDCHDGIDRFDSDFDHHATAFSLEGAHADLECRSCHAGTKSVEGFLDASQACVDCHQDDDAHNGNLGADCQACHSTTDWEVTDFDHSLSGFPLVDKHSNLECVDCHIDGLDHPIEQTCISCHADDDVHEGQLGSDCVACHNAAGWDQVLREDFDHNLTNYPLTGKHATLATCESCHAGGRLKGTPTECIACHRQDDQHNGEFGTNCATCHTTATWSGASFDHNLTNFRLTGAHADLTCTNCHENGRTEGTPDSCIGCHRSDDAHDGVFGSNCAACHNTSTWRNANFDHAQTGFALTGQHQGVLCESCHTNGSFSGTSTACVSCHLQDDAHDGAFGTECAACHSTGGWGGASFNHAQTGFPLTGQHQGVLCESCHTNGTFAGTSSDCVSCHLRDDAHDGTFGTNCAACHSTSGWGGASFDHNQTGFPLNGQHTSVACTTCHQNGQYAGTPTTCVNCHSQDDAHDGAFGTDCAACHSTGGWGGASFDHNQTGFPLNGQHTSVACTTCHQNGQYAGTPTTCVSCHSQDDAHNGSFGTDCAACHSTGGWGGASFDHSQTGFPLNGQHTSVACTSCHQNGQYAGTPTSCVSCHSQDDAHNGAFGTDCAACHSTSGWGGASFDHSQTGFPLTGDHRNAPCTACHQNGQYTGTPTACVSCHSEPGYHAGLFGTDCASCHSTSGWRPANYNRSHSFPMGHGNAGEQCSACHTDPLPGYLCTKCHEHNPDRMANVHDEEGIPDLSNCLGCHPGGRND